MASPLNTAWNRYQRALRRRARRTQAGQIAEEIERMAREGRRRPSRRDIRRLASRLRQLGQSGGIESSEVAGLVSEVARRTRRSNVEGFVIERLLDQLGPVGGILRRYVRRNKPSQRELEEQVEHALNVARGLNVAPDRPPEESGFRRVADEDIPQAPSWFQQRRATALERQRRQEQTDNFVRVQVGGRRRRYELNDPIVTGEMQPVESSNVHSIGYVMNYDNPGSGTLRVRFLQKNRRGKMGPGPLYEYSPIHPDVFRAFQRAASKGKWVWDRLRIRGTVSGHRVPYRLVGVVNGYVPRKATRYGGNEYFIQRSASFRSAQTGRERVFTSALPDRFVGNYRPVNRGRPQTGR